MSGEPRIYVHRQAYGLDYEVIAIFRGELLAKEVVKERDLWSHDDAINALRDAAYKVAQKAGMPMEHVARAMQPTFAEYFRPKPRPAPKPEPELVKEAEYEVQGFWGDLLHQVGLAMLGGAKHKPRLPMAKVVKGGDDG